MTLPIYIPTIMLSLAFYPLSFTRSQKFKQTKISKRIPYSPFLRSCLNNGENKSPFLLSLRRYKSSSLYYNLVYIPEHISCNSKQKTVWQFIYCLALVLKDMLTVLLCVGEWKLKVDRHLFYYVHTKLFLALPQHTWLVQVLEYIVAPYLHFTDCQCL